MRVLLFRVTSFRDRLSQFSPLHVGCTKLIVHMRRMGWECSKVCELKQEGIKQNKYAVVHEAIVELTPPLGDCVEENHLDCPHVERWFSDFVVLRITVDRGLQNSQGEACWSQPQDFCFSAWGVGQHLHFQQVPMWCSCH